jgi:hypothetical protein
MAPFDQRGVECDNGWLALIEELSAACEAYIESLAKSGVARHSWPRIAQIKEKFGGLRFYINGELPEELQAQVARAERETSYKICEKCGQPGTLRQGGWVHTYCDACETDYRANNLLGAHWVAEEMERRQANLMLLLESRAD